LVNPVVIEESGEQKEEEGCLSVPDLAEKVVRPARVRVRAGDASGVVREIEGTGLLARALCHETDHLNGLLFVDRLRGLKRDLTWRKIRRAREKGLGWASGCSTPSDVNSWTSRRGRPATSACTRAARPSTTSSTSATSGHSSGRTCSAATSARGAGG